MQEHFRDPIPGTPNTPGSRSVMRQTPYGRATPGGGRPGITPGAMSMAGGGMTPYSMTPGGMSTSRQNVPYTPTANTPFMTPMGTPG